MQDTVSPGEAALREILNGESEGHCYGFAASLVLRVEAFGEPKVDAVAPTLRASAND